MIRQSARVEQRDYEGRAPAADTAEQLTGTVFPAECRYIYPRALPRTCDAELPYTCTALTEIEAGQRWRAVDAI
ncbi:MAG: hypothetical protein ABI547_02525, partial [Betaproteobacteria bacterium]